MAIGDKRPVVMEADRAVAGGIATLGTDGKLLDAQIPGLDKLGAAPAGYGWGNANSIVNTTADPSVWESYADNLLAQIPAHLAYRVEFQDYYTEPFLTADGILYRATADGNTATIRGTTYDGHTVQRIKSGGVWKPWGWENPPMKLGTEYRTTERYNGKPVYVKLVNFGALPNAMQSTVSHGISDLEYCIDVSGNANGYNLIGYSGVEKVFCGTSSIAIKTSENLTAFSANVLLKYTKTTD